MEDVGPAASFPAVSGSSYGERNGSAWWEPADLRARRLALVEGAVGRVLDLGGALGPAPAAGGGPRRGEEWVVAPGELPPPGTLEERFDTVMCVLRLATEDHPADVLEAVAKVLRPDGRLLVLEPYRRPRWPGLVADLVAPWVRSTTGLVVNHPVPALVRGAGLVPASVQRFILPTLLAPLRSFCQVVALAPGEVT